MVGAVGSAGRVLGHAADFGLGGARLLGGLLSRPASEIEQPQTIQDVQEVLSGANAKPYSLRQTFLRRPTLSSVLTGGSRLPTASNDKESQGIDPASWPSATDDTVSMTSAPIASPNTASISSRLAALPGLGKLSGNQQLSEVTELHAASKSMRVGPTKTPHLFEC